MNIFYMTVRSERFKTAVKAVFCSLLICFACSMTSFDAQSREISSEVLRLHIIANSNSVEDQRIKLKVRDCVQLMCADIYPKGCTKSQARRLIEDKLPEIIEAAEKTVAKNGGSDKVSGELVEMYFNNRVYNGVTLPAGSYEALRLTIGSGEGRNWWCVMFPPICVSAASGDISDVLTDDQTDLVTSEKYTYKFKVYEIYENITNKIGTSYKNLE